MGNSCRHPMSSPSSNEWAGDDWGSLTSKSNSRKTRIFDENDLEKERLLLGELTRSSSTSSTSSSILNSNKNGEVKIKISKKDLEKLVGNHQGLSVEQILACLINATDGYHDHHDQYQRSWKPVLQTIPEVN
ncbi:DUF4228 domain-containing protein [Quillaja saponaria]|uniref:DUF4228 domain-containing protein n=1 Tax=Quillaja saponaria TaxID=32244 RepID=A0AAD7M0E8_QUISA|nr:DUF4228 domain-containing protein [Quillaja saponaria]